MENAPLSRYVGNGGEIRRTLLHLVCRTGAKQKGGISRESGWQGMCASITHFQARQETIRRVAKSTNEAGHESPKVALFSLLFFVKARPAGEIQSPFFLFCGTKPGENLPVTGKAKKSHACTQRNGQGLRTNVPIEQVGKRGEKGDHIEKPSASGGAGSSGCATIRTDMTTECPRILRGDFVFCWKAKPRENNIQPKTLRFCFEQRPPQGGAKELMLWG